MSTYAIITMLPMMLACLQCMMPAKHLHQGVDSNLAASSHAHCQQHCIFKHWKPSQPQYHRRRALRRRCCSQQQSTTKCCSSRTAAGHGFHQVEKCCWSAAAFCFCSGALPVQKLYRLWWSHHIVAIAYCTDLALFSVVSTAINCYQLLTWSSAHEHQRVPQLLALAQDAPVPESFQAA